MEEINSCYNAVLMGHQATEEFLPNPWIAVGMFLIGAFLGKCGADLTHILSHSVPIPVELRRSVQFDLRSQRPKDQERYSSEPAATLRTGVVALCTMSKGPYDTIKLRVTVRASDVVPCDRSAQDSGPDIYSTKVW